MIKDLQFCSKRSTTQEGNITIHHNKQQCKIFEGERYYWYLVAHNHAAGTSVTLLSNLILSIFQANRIVKASAVKLTNYYTDVR